MKLLILLLLPTFLTAQCKETFPIISISAGYQNGPTASIEAGFWQVKKSFQASAGVMAYNVEKSITQFGKTETYKDPIADPFVRVGLKLNTTDQFIWVVSGIASWRGVIGISGRTFYQIGPVTLAGLELGETNKGIVAKGSLLFTF